MCWGLGLSRLSEAATTFLLSKLGFTATVEVWLGEQGCGVQDLGVLGLRVSGSRVLACRAGFRGFWFRGFIGLVLSSPALLGISGISRFNPWSLVFQTSGP